MYNLVYFEDSRYVTKIGGPLLTLSAALEQMRLLTEGTNASPTKGYVGCFWERGGNTTCGLIVMDEWGHPIKSI